MLRLSRLQPAKPVQDAITNRSSPRRFWALERQLRQCDRELAAALVRIAELKAAQVQ